MKKLTARCRGMSGLLLPLVIIVAGPAVADNVKFEASLSGAQEVPQVISPGTGTATATFDGGLTLVEVDIDIKDLIGNVIGAHFHCGLPGTNGPVAFGLINPGDLVFDGKRIRGALDNGDFTGADCSAAIGRPVNNIASLAFAMREGLIYLNVHTDAVPSGEIRGQMSE